ncbi:hypothetical protein [Ornithinimicrobium kibberense]|uniref:hypothetical protein n=1 Tax=Ornithinimicrobium kibberense TaxID=282060 RepID=UPI00360D52F6
MPCRRLSCHERAVRCHPGCTMTGPDSPERSPGRSLSVRRAVCTAGSPGATDLRRSREPLRLGPGRTLLRAAPFRPGRRPCRRGPRGTRRPGR